MSFPTQQYWIKNINILKKNPYLFCPQKSIVDKIWSYIILL